jgi:hypothetical protein
MAAKAAHMRAVAKEKPKSMEAKEKKHVVFALEQDPVKRKEAAKICKRKIMAQMKKLLEKCNETCFYVGVLDNVPANVSNLSVLGPESVAELGSQLAVELSRFKVRLGDSYLPSSVETHDFDALSVDSLRALLKHVPPKLQKGTRHIWWIASSVPDGATNSRLSKEDSVTLCKAYVQHLAQSGESAPVAWLTDAGLKESHRSDIAGVLGVRLVAPRSKVAYVVPGLPGQAADPQPSSQTL